MIRKFFRPSLFIALVVIMCAGILGAGVVLPAKAVYADTVVTFPDPGLEAAIRDATGIPSGDIHKSDVEFLMNLETAENRNISDLTGLDNCTGLQFLSLSYNQISDIHILANMTNLKYLYMFFNQVSDITALETLNNLQYLSMYGNQIIDISPLQSLTGLVSLGLGANLISDITALQNLTALDYLDLSNNQITDIDALQNMTNLRKLYLNFNQITDIDALQNMTTLLKLKLSNNQISDISPLAANADLGSGDTIWVSLNYLDTTPGSPAMGDIQTLIARGATVYYDPQNAFSIWSLHSLSGNPGSITLLTDETQILVYQKAASAVTFSTGTWILKIKTDSDWKSSCQVVIGEYDAAADLFIPFDTTLTDPFENGYLTITLDQNSAGTVNPGNYLGFQITNSDGVSHEIILDGNSYVFPPDGSPDFPLPEMAAGILLGSGIIGLAAFVLIKRNKPEAGLES